MTLFSKFNLRCAFLSLLMLMSFGVGVSAQESEADTSAASETKETCPKDSDEYCIELRESINGTDVVKGGDGVTLLSNYIGLIYQYAASIIGIICVLIIVVSGVQIIMGGANSEMVNQAKERIMQALLSLVMLFGTGLLLKTINPGFFVA